MGMLYLGQDTFCAVMYLGRARMARPGLGIYSKMLQGMV